MTEQKIIWDRVAAWFKDISGASVIQLNSAQYLNGGAIQENWLLKLDIEGETCTEITHIVIRTDASSKIPFSHNRADEYAILRTIYTAGLKVPKPLWFCADKSILGKPFYAMEYVQGRSDPYAMVKGEVCPHLDLIAIQLAQQLAKLHRIKPCVDLSFLPDSTQPALELCQQYRKCLAKVKVEQRPILEWALHWLEINAPMTLPKDIALVHRDFRTGNFLADRTGLTAILDWEFAGWGDLYEDLGWFLSKSWRFGQYNREAGGLAAGAIFLEAYEKAAGRKINRALVNYWKVMALVRWAVIAILQGERHWSGQEFSLELALTGRRLAEIESDILWLLEHIERC
ncbi:MAG: phosphotransferase family protein [Alphaproteobacteria bacterium]